MPRVLARDRVRSFRSACRTRWRDLRKVSVKMFARNTRQRSNANPESQIQAGHAARRWSIGRVVSVGNAIDGRVAGSGGSMEATGALEVTMTAPCGMVIFFK